MSGQALQARSIAELQNTGLYSQLSLGSVFFAEGVKPPHFIPSWEKSPLVFLPIGELGSDGNFLSPYDFTTGEPVPSNWYFRLPVVTYMGSSRKVEFPLFDPFLMLDGKYDVTRNPYIWLRSTIAHMAKQEKFKHWSTLLERQSRDESAVLPKYSEKYFFHGLVFQEARGYCCDAKGFPRGLQAGDKTLAVVSMTRSAGEQLVKVVYDFAAGGEGSPSINLLDGSDGRYLVLTNPEVHTPQSYDGDALGQIQADITSSAALGGMEAFSQAAAAVDMSTGDDASNFKTYDVVAVKKVLLQIGKDKVKLFPSCPWAKHAAWANIVRAKYRPLTSLFAIPTHEEQIRLICTALADRPDILAAAFPPNSEFYTADVARALSNRAPIQTGALALSDEASADPMAYLSAAALKGRESAEVAGESALDAIFGDGGGTYAKAQSAFNG